MNTISIHKCNVLRVGTDCSGIDAPIEALKQLKIPFKHVFSSEIDKYCIESIKANYKPDIIFGDKDGLYPDGDITRRNILDVPDIDLYVCGFPCQPFSSAGKKKGFNDKRGCVFFSCIEVIENKSPSYLILSNDNGNTWKEILKCLSILQSKYNYIIKFGVLNTRHYGIPQNRERLFIVGSKKPFLFPPIKKPMRNLFHYVDSNNHDKNQINKSISKNINKDAIFIDLNFSRYNDTYPNAHKWCPCLNTNNGLWNIKLTRFATVKERLKLQGFRTNFKQVISNKQINKQIGNSMSINVLKSIYIDIFE